MNPVEDARCKKCGSPLTQQRFCWNERCEYYNKPQQVARPKPELSVESASRILSEALGVSVPTARRKLRSKFDGVPVSSNDVEFLLSLYEAELGDQKRRGAQEVVIEVRKRFRALVSGGRRALLEYKAS